MFWVNCSFTDDDEGVASNITYRMIERTILTYEQPQLVQDTAGVTQRLPEGHRIALISVGILLGLVSFLGNLAVLIVILRRKQQRMLYRCSLVSLALADLILGLCYVIVNVPKFFIKFANSWPLGSAMCQLMPLLLMMCLMINAMTISLIALDRYRAVQGGAKKWEPSFWTSISIILIIWIVSIGIAIPQFFSYDFIGPINFFQYFPPSLCLIDTENYYFCTLPSDNKIIKAQYFTTVFLFIFLPLFVAFVGFYFKVAKYIWSQSTPTSSHVSALESSEESTTSIKQKKPKKLPPQIFKNGGNSNFGSRSTLLTDTGSDSPLNARKVCEISDASESVPNKPRPKIKRTPKMKRKIRTIRVIMLLILSCFFARLPSWLYNIIQSYPEIQLTDISFWLLQFWFNLLSLSSTAINPFLYCFLNETLAFSEVISNWFSKMVTRYFCVKTDTNMTDSTHVIVHEQNQQNISISMIPRGPYQHKENRVDSNPVQSPANHI